MPQIVYSFCGNERREMKCPRDILKREGLRTQRQWKSRKRQEFKKVLKAFGIYRFGCAYAPGWVDRDIDKLGVLLESVKEKLSVKEWGR
jgi:hypothetical protein